MDRGEKNSSRVNKIGRITILSVALVAIVMTLVPWYSDRLQNKSLDQAADGFQVDSLHTAEEAASLNPFSVDALFVLAGAEQRLGRDDQAKKSLQRAVELEPQNYITWEQVALYERDHWKMPEAARENFARAIDLNPQDQQLRQEAGFPFQGDGG